MATTRKTSRAGLAALLLTVPTSLGAVLGGRWCWYVTRGATPYDEIGIELNSRMPNGPRGWGCARIAERFPARSRPTAARGGEPHPSRARASSGSMIGMPSLIG